MNKIKTHADMRHCIKYGLDYTIYRLGLHRIKKMIQRRHGIELSIEGQDLDEVTRKVQAIDLGSCSELINEAREIDESMVGNTGRRL